MQIPRAEAGGALLPADAAAEAGRGPLCPGLQFEPRDQSLRLGLSQVQGILAAYTPQETLVSVP